MPGLIAEEAALGFGASGRNLVPHLGHFRRLPAAASGTFNRMPHCVHWVVCGIVSATKVFPGGETDDVPAFDGNRHGNPADIPSIVHV